MDSVSELPRGYVLYDHIDLQKDKRTALKVNIWATAILAALLLLGHFAFVPVTRFYSADTPLSLDLIRLAALLAVYLAYMVLHELTHAAAMKLYHASKIRFGFTGLYAYAGSETDYFGKSEYRVIALAPLVVWTLLLTLPLLFISDEWFWVFYFTQCGNLAGCIGDIYVTVRLLKAPRDILVRDTGVEMYVYSRQGKAGYINKRSIG